MKDLQQTSDSEVPDLSLMKTFFSICLYINSILFISSGIFSFIIPPELDDEISSPTSFPNIMISIWIIIFGIILIAFELNMPSLQQHISSYLGFLFRYQGRYTFLFFVGTLNFSNDIFGIVVASLTFLHGIVVILLLVTHENLCLSIDSKYKTSFLLDDTDDAESSLETSNNNISPTLEAKKNLSTQNKKFDNTHLSTKDPEKYSSADSTQINNLSQTSYKTSKKTHHISSSVAMPSSSSSLALPTSHSHSKSQDSNFKQDHRASTAISSTQTLGGQNCTQCNEIIEAGDQTKKAFGVIFHQKCFSCYRCHTPFTSGSISKLNNKWYCIACTTQSSAPGICHSCLTPIKPTEISLSFNKVDFHQNCFKCSSCQKVLSTKNVVPVEGSIYCDKCGKKAFIKSMKSF